MVYFLSMAGFIACKDAGPFKVFSCPSTPSSTFYKLLEIERREYLFLGEDDDPYGFCDDLLLVVGLAAIMPRGSFMVGYTAPSVHISRKPEHQCRRRPLRYLTPSRSRRLQCKDFLKLPWWFFPSFSWLLSPQPFMQRYTMRQASSLSLWVQGERCTYDGRGCPTLVHVEAIIIGS